MLERTSIPAATGVTIGRTNSPEAAMPKETIGGREIHLPGRAIGPRGVGGALRHHRASISVIDAVSGIFSIGGGRPIRRQRLALGQDPACLGKLESGTILAFYRRRLRTIDKQKPALPELQLEQMPALGFELRDLAHWPKPIGQRTERGDIIVTTDAPMPKPKVNTPKMQAMLGTRIMIQLLRTLRLRSRAISRNWQSFPSPCSMKTTCAGIASHR